MVPTMEWRNPTTGGVVPFSCNSWRCPECSPVKKRRLEHRLAEYADSLHLRRFLTLTLAPRTITAEMLSRFVIFPTIEDEAEANDYVLMEAVEYVEMLLYTCSGQREQRNRERFDLGGEADREELQHIYWRYLSYVWNKYRTMLKRKYPGLSYILMKEPHKDGIRPHLHLLINTYIPVDIIRESFPKYGGGHQVYIEYIQENNVQSSISYITKYLTKMAEAEKQNLFPRGLRRITVSRDINLSLSPEDFQQWQEHREEHGTQTVGLLNEAGEPTYNCIQGHEDEYIEAMEHEPCKKCPYRKSRKCKPFHSEWRLWSDTFAGGWVSQEPTCNDPVILHNQIYKNLCEPREVLYEYSKEYKRFIPFIFRGVDPAMVIPDIYIHDRYSMDETREDVQKWIKSRFATLAEMRWHETKHDKGLCTRSATEECTLLC